MLLRAGYSGALLRGFLVRERDELTCGQASFVPIEVERSTLYRFHADRVGIEKVEELFELSRPAVETIEVPDDHGRGPGPFELLQELNRAMYDLFVLASLYTIGVGAVSRWQASGLLGACLVAVCWLLAGDSLAVMLRFADISGAPQHPSASGAALALIASLCAVITAVRGAGSPTRTSRLGSRRSLRRS